MEILYIDEGDENTDWIKKVRKDREKREEEKKRRKKNN
ncbi:MAG: hypothetical protein AEth_00451 [Candidatus Argoarchaeum ethanivorans]|uniref:Uncharacterized protein n=1 Tax=Candidatus Argoarchaeum ethanivorans TaxID=2608793 RepID=A0A8B6SDI8_9EURY|nr:MAG: hypothetical protein AEth_00451 [Candidatus Argoarchaeum ethanivorans]